MTDRLLTVAEVSLEFFMPEDTIRTWVKRGRVEWCGPGLISERLFAEAERRNRKQGRINHLVDLAAGSEPYFATDRRISQPVNLRLMSRIAGLLDVHPPSALHLAIMSRTVQPTLRPASAVHRTRSGRRTSGPDRRRAQSGHVVRDSLG